MHQVHLFGLYVAWWRIIKIETFMQQRNYVPSSTTPTESGAVASAYAIVLGTVVYREIGVKELLDVFKNTIGFTAIIFCIISIAGLYGWLLVRLQIPMTLAEGVVKLTTNPTLLLLILMEFFLIIGYFMSVIESVLIFTPIMVPMVKMMGIDPLFLAS